MAERRRGEVPSALDRPVGDADAHERGDARIVAREPVHLRDAGECRPEDAVARVDAHAEDGADAGYVARPELARRGARCDLGNCATPNARNVVLTGARIVVHSLRPERCIGQRRDNAAPRYRRTIAVEPGDDARESR